jgi:antibiotic biosynthesis monooxygenase (ABM) superfamily enzyme
MRPVMQSPQSVATKLRVVDGAHAAFSRWQARLTHAATVQPGFLSIEFIPLQAGSCEWRVVQCFRAPGLLDAWLAAPSRRRLLEEGANWVDGTYGDESAPDFHGSSSVTEVIVTAVQQGREPAFYAWCEAIQAAQGEFPGYMGTLVQAPPSAAQPVWTTLVRFSKPEQLDAWLFSSRRRALLDRSEGLVESWKSHRMPSSFAGWFPGGQPEQGASAAWKQAAIVLLVLFPAVMLELRFLSPRLAGLNPAIATFIGNAISVALVTWPLAPLAIRSLRWWLRPDPAGRTRAEILGGATVIALYGIELGTFWSFL